MKHGKTPYLRVVELETCIFYKLLSRGLKSMYDAY